MSDKISDGKEGKILGTTNVDKTKKAKLAYLKVGAKFQGSIS